MGHILFEALSFDIIVKSHVERSLVDPQSPEKGDGLREVHTDDGTLFLWPNTHTEISPRDVESQRGEGMEGKGSKGRGGQSPPVRSFVQKCFRQHHHQSRRTGGEMGAIISLGLGYSEGIL